MSGWDAENINDFVLHLCPCCRLILREPVQLQCGHRVCKGCVDAIHENVVRCLTCREPSRKSSVKLDRGCMRDMASLSIECSICDWTGRFEDYESHRQTKCSSSVTSESIHIDHIVSNPVRIEDAVEDSDRERSASPPIDIGQTIPINPVTQTIVVKNNPELEEISQALQLLTEHLHDMAADIERSRQARNVAHRFIENAINDLATIQQAQAEQNATMETILRNNEVFSGEIASLRRQFDEQQQASYNGSLLWKIPHVREKMQAAQTGPLYSIDSVPFCSHPSGYKLCTRVFLNGDPASRGRNLSLYFFLTRSDFDAILHFPFNFKVIFCLYDQSGEQHHIIKCYQPNLTVDDVQQPRLSINSPVGFSNFVSLEHIQQHRDRYLKDDTMFIRVMIDFLGLPDDMFSYAMSSNLELPIEVQQRKIVEEMQRRAQQFH